jgi:hypothetical protein
MRLRPAQFIRRALITMASVHAALALFTSSSFLLAQDINEEWRYTFQSPREGWEKSDFKDDAWSVGFGGFGTPATPGARLGTEWRTNNIWLRKTFDVSAVPKNAALLMHHDEDVEVFINGVKVATESSYSTEYKVVPLNAEQASAVKSGKNVMAVHCKQTGGGQYIDVHFVNADAVPKLPAAKRSTVPFKSELITTWGSEVTADNAWQEYPRPQLERSQWTNLNGHWDYGMTANTEQTKPATWDGKILVPFCLESKLGGVQRLLLENEALWYHRTFNATPKENERTLLNFEAVDYRCEVFVNGVSVGKHQGGHTPFAIDISDAVKAGDNELIVRVEDETEAWQLNGKQVKNAHAIWYTQVSGIWQTVWLEQVPRSYIEDLTIKTNAADGSIAIRTDIGGDAASSKIKLVVMEGDKQVAEVTGTTTDLSVKIPNAKLWTPNDPHLYSLQVSLLDGSGKAIDQVDSYTGIRTVGKVRDAEGHWRLTLNGKVIFHFGPLDQGWWPDGLLTPPSDAGMKFDIEYLKEAGFNMIRKHIKVEPRRYYYYCDQIGMMLWQDQVSAGHNPPWTRMEANPTDAEWPDAEHQQYMVELERMIDHLESQPSIVVWVPFNEAWGQHRTVEVGKWTVARDPSRTVNIASGGNFWPVGDIADHHNYPHPDFPFEPKRYDDFVKVVGEFGGHGYPVPHHIWNNNADNWGYGGLPKNEAEYRDRYAKSIDILKELKKKGIAAGVYTQTTDVEGEINGLITYDRKVIKIPAKELAAMHKPLIEQ